MKNYAYLFISLFLVFVHTTLSAQETVNGGFELTDQKGIARNWLTDNADGKFNIGLDKRVHRSGHQSLMIDGSKNSEKERNVGITANVFGSLSSTKITNIQISAWIKSDEKLDSTVSIFIQNGQKIIRIPYKGTNVKGWNKIMLNFQTPTNEEWYRFYYGIELSSNRLIWIDDFNLTVNGIKIEDQKNLYKEPSVKSIKWLSANLSAIKSIDTAQSTADLHAMGDALKNAKIVGLGEATHGTGEVTKFKTRLLKYLITEKNFSTIALEESIATCDQMNRLLNLPSVDLKDSLIKMPFYKLWKTEEMLGLFKWLHNYNLSHDKKIRFIGIDMEDMGLKNSRNMLRTYGRMHNEEILTQTIKIDKNLDTLLELSKISMVAPKTIDAANKLKHEITALDQLLVKDGKKIGDELSLFNLRSYARVCKQWLESRFFSGSRDEFMAENINIFMSEHPNQKVFLWAHNFHVANAEVGGQKTMGAFLKGKFADEYFPISITTASGSYMATANYAQKNWLSYPLEQAYRGTYEYIFSKVEPSLFFLNLLKVNQHSNSSWLNVPMKQLDIAYIYSNEDNYQYLGTLKKSFDGVVFLKHTTASISLLK